MALIPCWEDIEDVLIDSLEREAGLPDDIVVYVEPEALAFLLAQRNTDRKTSPGCQALEVRLAGVRLEIRSDDWRHPWPH